MADTFKTWKVTVEGVAPLILHNGQLANPFYEYTKALKALTTQFKRNKTDEFYTQHAKLEWEGSLYLNDKGQVIIPSDLFQAALVKAGKRQRKGDLVKTGVFVDGDSILKYDGPKDIKALWENSQFRDDRMVVVNQSRVPRCRPRFNQWGADVVVQFDSEQLQASEMKGLLETAGRYCGVGDHRPTHGRFEVTNIKEV